MLIYPSLQAFFDLENTNQELKSDLKDLYINQAVYVVLIFDVGKMLITFS